MERVTGIEPAYAAWEAAVLPLNYTRIKSLHQIRPFQNSALNSMLVFYRSPADWKMGNRNSLTYL
jgi:hypothetical protein